MTLGEFHARWQKRRNDLAQFHAQVDGATLIDRLLADLEEVSEHVETASPAMPPVETKNSMLAAKDAAEYMGLAPQTLAKMRLSGDSPPFYKLGRRVLYKRGELDSWIAVRRRRSTSDTGPE